MDDQKPPPVHRDKLRDPSDLTLRRARPRRSGLSPAVTREGNDDRGNAAVALGVYAMMKSRRMTRRNALTLGEAAPLCRWCISAPPALPASCRRLERDFEICRNRFA